MYLLHKISGFGVRPFLYSCRKLEKTLSQYSLTKSTRSSSNPRLSATLLASIQSFSCGHTSSSAFGLPKKSLLAIESQLRINAQVTSSPCCFKRYAATAESTPPDKPTKIFIIHPPFVSFGFEEKNKHPQMLVRLLPGSCRSRRNSDSWRCRTAGPESAAAAGRTRRSPLRRSRPGSSVHSG